MVNIQQIKVYDHETNGFKDLFLVTAPGGKNWTAPVGLGSKDILAGLWLVWGQIVKHAEGIWNGNGAQSKMQSAASEVMAFINWLDPLPQGGE